MFPVVLFIILGSYSVIMLIGGVRFKVNCFNFEKYFNVVVFIMTLTIWLELAKVRVCV